MAIDITASAWEKINALCNTTPPVSIRLKIEAGGCHGFNKVWGTTTIINDDDITYDNNNSILVIDPDSYDILTGAVIDYVNNISGSFFSVNIPDSASCGCGHSFSI